MDLPTAAHTLAIFPELFFLCSPHFPMGMGTVQLAETAIFR